MHGKIIPNFIFEHYYCEKSSCFPVRKVHILLFQSAVLCQKMVAPDIRQAFTHIIERGIMNDKGYIQLYTGDGKGKTTASLGLALRGWGSGMNVLIIQFLKKGDYSEIKALAALGARMTVEQYGMDGFYIPGKGDLIGHRAQVKRGYTSALAAVHSGVYDMVICDEIINALSYSILTFDEILALLHQKNETVELVMTGRDAPEELYDHCDLVTEMTERKHYYTKGVKARIGIEM